MDAKHFKKAIDFLTINANHSLVAPEHQRGIQFILAGRKLTLLAVNAKETTGIEMEQKVSAGAGTFFVPFDDLLNIEHPLRYESTGDREGKGLVSISRSEQPFVPGLCAGSR